MKRNIRIATGFACGVFALAMAGCAKEQPLEKNGSRLQVVGIALEKDSGSDAAQSSPQTRAAEVNKIFTFEDGDALSLFMRGATYADVDNRRVDYSKPGAAAGTWAIGGTEILLNDRTAVVSLVHPYAGANAYDNIPFVTGPYSTGIDLLWKQQDVYAAASEAQVAQMKHALTRVKFTVQCDDPTDTTIPDRFTGTGAVTKVAIDNGTTAGSGTAAAVFSAGKLDLSFVAPASPVSGVTEGPVEDATAFTLSIAGHTADLLTLPVAAMQKDLVALEITVDGTTLTTSLPFAAPADKWEAGKCYAYTVTVKSKGIEVSSATVENWTAGTSGDNDVTVPTAPPSVGDYVYDDGTFSTKLKAGKTPVGVVFWVNPDDSQNFKAVSLDERASTTKWSTENVTTGATSTTTGAENMAKIKAISGWHDKYPPFAWCDDKTEGGSGWYVPAIDELQYLYCASIGAEPTTWMDYPNATFVQENRDSWNARFTAPGVGGAGLNINSGYWSATEESSSPTAVWDITSVVGYSYYYSKDDNNYVRCVREYPIPPPPVVNDYYYSDGSFSTALEDGKTPVGVIFWVNPDDGTNFKIVSLDEVASKEWSTESVTTGATGTTNGAENMAKVKAMPNYPAKYPAFAWCDDKTEGGNGWYLPAKNELLYLYCASVGAPPVTWSSGATGAPVFDQGKRDTWNDRFTATGVGGAGFTGNWCWSATEYSSTNAWIVAFSVGYTNYSTKANYNYVRCVREI